MCPRDILSTETQLFIQRDQLTVSRLILYDSEVNEYECENVEKKCLKSCHTKKKGRSNAQNKSEKNEHFVRRFMRFARKSI